MFPLCTSVGDVEISDILSRDTVTASPRLEVQARSREPPGQVVAGNLAVLCKYFIKI